MGNTASFRDTTVDSDGDVGQNESSAIREATTPSEPSKAASAGDTAQSSSLSGMPLVHRQCRPQKKAYDKCVRRWYKEEFVPGGGTLEQEEACGDRFEDYRACVLKGIRREVWDKQGLPPPSENSPLSDVEDEQ